MRLSWRLASTDARVLWSTPARQYYTHGVKPFPRACQLTTHHAFGGVHSNRMNMQQFSRALSNNASLIQSPIDGTNSTTNETNYSEIQSASPLVESNMNRLLESDVGSWTRQDRLLVQSVLAGILGRRPDDEKYQSNPLMASSDSTQLLIRWIHEYCSSITVPVGTDSNDEKRELKDMGAYLITVLNRWRQCLEIRKSQPRNMNVEIMLSEPTVRAVQLLRTFFQSNVLSMLSADNFGRKIYSDKAFSLIFDILAFEIKNNPASYQLCRNTADLMLRRCTSSFTTSNSHVWNSYLRVLAESSKFIPDSAAKAEDIVLRQEKFTTKSVNSSSETSSATTFSFDPDTVSYAIVLHAWANSERTDSAERAVIFLETIRSKDPSAVDSVCYNTCIRALSQAGQAQKAEDFLWKMHQEFIQGNGENVSVRPDPVSFLGAIDGWSRGGQPERAKALLEQMIALQQNNPLYRSRLYPTAAIFTTVMNAYARHQKNSGPHVESMLCSMEQMYFHPADARAPFNSSKPCKPSQTTYMVAIQAWANTKHPDAPIRAEAIFNRMAEYGAMDADLMPNIVTYSALIKAWAYSTRGDAPQRAMSILRRMTESGDSRAAPNTVTYNTVIFAFAKNGMMREAHDLLDQLIEASSKSDLRTNPVKERVVHPDIGTFAAVIQGYSRKLGCGKVAHELLVQMERWLDQKSDHSSKTYKALQASNVYFHTVNSLSRSNMIEEADSVLWDMVKRYEGFNRPPHNVLPPDAQVCDAVLSAWSKCNLPCAPNRALRVWRWMDEQNAAGKYKHVRPTSETAMHMFTILMDDSIRTSANQQIEGFYDEVKIKYPGLLNTPLLQPVLQRYEKIRR